MSLLSVASAPVAGGVAPELHAPDRFLTVPIALLFWVISAAVIGLAVRRTNRELDEKMVPLMGVMAAFIFAAQMFNFQVGPGMTGHLLGGVLAAVLLGPWAGTLVMASVVAVQALVYQDGGLLVLGANIFNMGVIGTLGGYAVYRILCRLLGGEHKARIPAAGIAAWLAVVAGATAMSVELALSGTTELLIAMPTMVGIHVLIGIGEAVITMAALAFIQATRSDLFQLRDAGAASSAPAGA